MIPLDLSVNTKVGEKKLHFEIINHPKLTPCSSPSLPLTVSRKNAIYGEGTTLHLTAKFASAGASRCTIENRTRLAILCA